MSLLTLVQSACLRIGLPSPATVIGSTDTQVLQLMELCNEEGQELSERYQWQMLRQEASFTTVATEIQGSLSIIAPGCKTIINDTIWDRDLRRPIFGPLSAQRWQQYKAVNLTGPWYQFRVMNNEIHFIPVPGAGDECDFEYVSKYWVANAAAPTTGVSDTWTADTDVALFDEKILVMGLIWRWKAAKGLSYGEDFDKYERRIMDAMSQDGSKDVLNLSDIRWDVFPGIIVPSGSWGVP